jgi:hypothetical protein
MKAKGKFGCIFILVSGLLFTTERYISVLIWSTLATPLLTMGAGYSALPDMPDLKTNFFVILFMLFGVSLLLLEIYDTYKKK